MHFYRLTPDNRILVGGGPGLVPYGGSMDHDAYPEGVGASRTVHRHDVPALGGIRITNRWGGAFSVTSDSTPQIGTLHGGAAVYSIGCTGHGVAMTHMNGRIIRDLVLGRKTELTDLWFVNRRSLPIPPEPIRSLAVKAVIAGMSLDDWWCERGAIPAMNVIRKIAIIGATGMLGIPVTIALLDAGFAVTALARKPDEAKRMLPAATRIVAADARDEASFKRGLAGQDALYLSLSVAPSERKGDFHTEQQGLEHILAAAREVGIKRIGYLSAMVQDTRAAGGCSTSGAARSRALRARASRIRSSTRATLWKRCRSGT